jgi:hypothetical protein
MKILPGTIKILGVMGLLALAACTHVKGQVLEDRTLRPVTDAELTVGHPDGLGAFQRVRVDAKGKFDFYISPTDQDFLYVWDGKGDVLTAARRIERGDISDHMTIYMPQGRGE